VKRGDVVWVRGVVTSAYDDQNFAYTISNDPAVKLHIIPAEVIAAMADAIRTTLDLADANGTVLDAPDTLRAALAAFDASRGGKP
jgi:hypothetical protein